MERDVTVSVRSLVLAGVVVLALLAGWVLGGAPRGYAGARGRRRGPGHGARRSGRPPYRRDDRGRDGFRGARRGRVRRLGGLTRPDLSAALDDASTTMAKVLARLADFGVVKDRVQTTGLAMDPVYDYPSYGPPVLRGYRVTQRARVTVPRLDRAGGAISAAVRTGGNAVRIGDIRLLVGDRGSVLEQARDAAVAEATAKAEQYAGATGQSLGDVLSLREVRARSPRASYPVGYAALRAADAAKVPIEAGENELKVTVRVVWSFG